MLKYAYALYCESCVGVNHKESYSQFAEDFINFKRYVNCNNEAVCMNIHNVNYHRLKRLFLHYETLVRNYFDKDTFTDEDCEKLIDEFLKSETHTATSISIPATNDSTHRLPTFECTLNPEQVAIITKAVNESQVFSRDVTQTEIQQLFNCTLPYPLMAKTVRKVVTVFHALMSEDVIPFDWQKILGAHGYILSPVTNRPLKRSNFSSSLNDIKLDDRQGNSIIRKMAIEVGKISRKEKKEMSDGTRT